MSREDILGDERPCATKHRYDCVENKKDLFLIADFPNALPVGAGITPQNPDTIEMLEA